MKLTAYRVAEWIALVLGALFLWWSCSLVTAVVFVALELLLLARRAHFVDVGRFTAGVWPVNPAGPSLIFGVAWAFHGEGRNAKKAGLEVIVGPVVIGVFSLVPRAEWPAYKRTHAEFVAEQKKGRRR